jgi:hypothetical protein
MLPRIDHCHYDEVQQSTGVQFFGLLMEWIPSFTYFTGTSATPKTCNSEQHVRLHQLFGSPLSVLHQCEMDEAVQEGWIAQPKIIANVVECGTRISEFVGIVAQSIVQKMARGTWKYGKIIVYLDTIADVQNAVRCALHHFNRRATIYMAVKRADEPEPEPDNATEGESDTIVDGARSDTQFIDDAADGSPRILFACKRYRQGSDIKGIEMTAVLFHSTIATNVFVQIMGRALRKDAEYDNKEGWCVAVKTRDQDDADAPEDVMTSILLDFANFMLTTSGSVVMTKQKLREVLTRFLVPLQIDNGVNYSIDETVERMQCMYLRKEYERAAPKEKYEIVRALNRELGIATKDEYTERASEHSKFIADPKTYFTNNWVSWYHFLGVDTRAFPQTKQEWVCACMDAGIVSWSHYKDMQKNMLTLPANPGDMYEDYTNWDREFGIEDEVVW